MSDMILSEVRDHRQRQEQQRDRYSSSSLQISVGLSALIVSTVFLSSQIIDSNKVLPKEYAITFLVSIGTALIVIGCAACIHFRIIKWNYGPDTNQLKSLLLSLTNNCQKTIRIIGYHEQAIKQNAGLLKGMRVYFIILMFSTIFSIGCALLAGTILLATN